MSYDREALKARLVQEEGEKLKPYYDSKGILTIGVGRNIQDNGITHEEAMFLLDHDISCAEHDLDQHIPWWGSLSPIRQSVLVDMCFNMGWGNGHSGLSSFVNTIEAIRTGNYAVAAANIRQSQYAKDTGVRAIHNAFALEHDYFPLV